MVSQFSLHQEILQTIFSSQKLFISTSKNVQIFNISPFSCQQLINCAGFVSTGDDFFSVKSEFSLKIFTSKGDFLQEFNQFSAGFVYQNVILAVDQLGKNFSILEVENKNITEISKFKRGQTPAILSSGDVTFRFFAVSTDTKTHIFDQKKPGKSLFKVQEFGVVGWLSDGQLMILGEDICVVEVVGDDGDEEIKVMHLEW